MPYSSPVFDQKIKMFLKEHDNHRFLDVGAGAGKYGKLIREVAPQAYCEAIESSQDYIKEFDLNAIYNRVNNVSIQNILNFPDFYCDVVILGDVLEHLPKADGLNVVHFLAYRCKYLLCVFPLKYVQYSWQGNVQEAHISLWSRSDFSYLKNKTYTKQGMMLVIAQGLLGDPDTIFEPTTKSYLEKSAQQRSQKGYFS